MLARYGVGEKSIRLPDFEIRLRQKSAIYRTAGLGFHTFESLLAKVILGCLGFQTFELPPEGFRIALHKKKIRLRHFWVKIGENYGGSFGNCDPASRL